MFVTQCQNNFNVYLYFYYYFNKSKTESKMNVLDLEKLEQYITVLYFAWQDVFIKKV
jgi:hypothetical protein